MRQPQRRLAHLSGRPSVAWRAVAVRPGQKMVEFALTVVIVLALLLGTAQVLLVAYAQGVVLAAAQDGARQAAELPRTADPLQAPAARQAAGAARADAVLRSGLGRLVGATITVDVSAAETVTVIVAGRLPALIGGGDLPLTGRSTTRKELGGGGL
ncbi:MAG: pilus assembly protein [Chloroflexi bacterium]|nr:pilus assembly protein [Chloroflexota bacterium]